MNNYAEMLADNLDEELKLKVTKLNINVFKNLYAPYITGERKHDNIVVKWIELAGSPYLPVELIDDEGNVVDTVPPLMNPSISENLGITGNFDNQIVEGKLKEDTYGSGAPLNSVAGNLAEKIKGASDDIVNAWSEVIKKYGKEKVNTEHSSSFEEEDDIELNFD